MPKSNRTRTRVLIGVSLVCLWVMAVWGVGPVAALPPRPSPSPSPSPIPESVPATPGGLIKLTVTALSSDVWTVVQWRDARGDWHDVEGWRGTLDEIARGVGAKTWWVARGDFGKGPFRWVVYSNAGGTLLVASDVFNLPMRDEAAVQVAVSLK